MWTVLEDTTRYVAFNHLHVPDSDGLFAQVELNWAPLTAEGYQPQHLTFNRVKAHNEQSTAADKELHVVNTDYYSYLIGQTCKELGGNVHETDYFVWTREKQPPMFIRNKIRNYFVSKDIDTAGLTKSKLVDCWGKDLYN